MRTAPVFVAQETLHGASFEARVRAAAGAGFAGFGIRPDEWHDAHRRGLTDADLQAMLDDHGVAIMELEALRGWHSPPAERDPDAPTEDTFYAIADALGARHLAIRGDLPGLDPNAPDAVEHSILERAAEQLTACADRAAGHGLLLMMEPHSRFSVRDPRVAWEIIRRADRPNVGLKIDTWHHFRVHPDLDSLRAIPAERFFALQLGDGDPTLVDSLVEDRVHRCRLPGDGSFDLVGILQLFDAWGLDVPISVEVTNDELRALDPDERARRTGAATRALLDKALSR